MNKWLMKIRDGHDVIYKVSLFILSVVFIVSLFPKEAQFQYEIQKQKPWLYEDLFAPFDIPILKSEAQVQREVDSLTKAQLNYFKMDLETIDKVKDDLRQNINASWDSVWNATHKNDLVDQLFKEKSEEKRKLEKQNHIDFGISLLEAIYNKGVIDYNGLGTELRLVKNGVEIIHQSKQFFTLNQALEFVEKSVKNQEGLKQSYLIAEVQNAIAPNPYNVVKDESYEEEQKEQILENFVRTIGVVEKGELIIAKGERVNDQKYLVLMSFKEKFESRSNQTFNYWWVLLGEVLLTSVLITMLGLYLLYFRPLIVAYNNNIVFILLQVNLSVLFTHLALEYFDLNVLLLPYCLAPLVVRAFYDSRTALFTHLVAVLLCAFFVADSFQFIFIQMVAGLVALVGFVNLKNRAQLFVTAGLIFVAYVVCFFGFEIMHEGEVEQVRFDQMLWLAGGAAFTLSFYPLIYLYEKIFGLVSDMSLLELADTNNKLLRDLALKAPGTFQHSMQVANLAEAAIFAIGGNALLVRTGALYHDIGKMKMPRYFIENQGSGVNPHDEISNEDSARIIIGHVLEGIEMAKKHKLPDQIIDFIRTHHGTTMTRYFYTMEVKNEGEEMVDREMYTYPGPIPFSKETAVLMMADSVEAASRAIKDPDAQKIDQLVENIIKGQIAENQFVNADITLKDITQIKKIFKKMLMNIYHVRVEYPR